MLQDAIRTVAETEEVGRFFLVCTPPARDREGREEREYHMECDSESRKLGREMCRWLWLVVMAIEFRVFMYS